MRDHVDIVGAGPAGLAAAITLVNNGVPAVVWERSRDVGHRFHDDFQGFENWTTRGDALEELAELGIAPTFEYTAFRECVFFDPVGREYVYKSSEPLWYVVRRGSKPGTVDSALREQATRCGVDLRFGVSKQHLPKGGIVAHGPHRADAIAVGYVFETRAADGAYSAISDRLAPQGYSYLLISGGRGTLASCMFGDFHNERVYLERTLHYFKERVGVEMTNPRRFGGFGNVFPEPTARRGRLLFAGEAAGFQDALFGFGMRYSMLSGHLAAQAILSNQVTQYDKLIRRRFGGLLKMAIVNRYLYERLGDRGYSRLLRQIDRAADAREWLRRFYGPGWRQYVFYRLALRQRARRRALIQDCPESCDCTWCRCERHGGVTDAVTH